MHRGGHSADPTIGKRRMSSYITKPQSVFAALGKDWVTILRVARSYEELRCAIVSHNDSGTGRFAAAVRRYVGVCSNGEFRLVIALCALADFGHLADELSAGKAWQDIARGCDRKFRAAIAACVENAP